MLALADERTLIEDWLARRQRVAASVTMPEQHRQMQLQLLDYLIGRYGDSPEADRPARFASPFEFYSNDRTIVVHHHLGRGKIAGVRNQAEAKRRVGDILSHLRSVHELGAEVVPAHNDFACWVDELDERPEVPGRAWREILRAVHRGRSAHQAIAAALEQSPYLPRAALAYLCRCLSEPVCDMATADLLLQCRSVRVPVYAVCALRERVNKGCFDEVTSKLRAHLASEPSALDAIRARLADANGEVRVWATELLRQGGTLDDVALLSDLVSLQPLDDEDPRERQALLDAMWAIAHRD